MMSTSIEVLRPVGSHAAEMIRSPAGSSLTIRAASDMARVGPVSAASISEPSDGDAAPIASRTTSTSSPS